MILCYHKCIKLTCSHNLVTTNGAEGHILCPATFNNTTPLRQQWVRPYGTLLRKGNTTSKGNFERHQPRKNYIKQFQKMYTPCARFFHLTIDALARHQGKPSTFRWHYLSTSLRLRKHSQKMSDVRHQGGGCWLSCASQPNIREKIK
jgi:hypothetical protein